MTVSYNEEELRRRVRAVIARTLRVPVEEVKDDSELVDELGADSMDFIDITFKLGQEFDVEFCEEGMVAKLEELLGPNTISRQGLLTDLGARVMRDRRPEIDSANIRPNMPFAHLNDLVTTETWVRGVKEVLGARPRGCPACGSERLSPLRPSLLGCDDCGGEIQCPTQAEVLETWVQEFREPAGPSGA